MAVILQKLAVVMVYAVSTVWKVIALMEWWTLSSLSFPLASLGKNAKQVIMPA